MICQALNKAQHSIFLMMYSVSDPDVLAFLDKKAREGVRVTVLTDAKETTSQRKPASFDLIPVRSSGLMHRKVLIIDEKEVFIGSANLTTSSLKLHDNFMIGLHHPDLAVQLAQCSKNSYEFSIDGQTGEFWFLPDRSGKALSAMLHLIEQAKTSIRVAMFTLTHPRLIEALESAFKRGVDVEVAVDFFTGQGASYESVIHLHQTGIPVYFSTGAQLFHHKWMLVDKKILINGSANWTQAAFEKNEDDFLIFYSLTKDQKKFMKSMWKTIRLETDPISQFIE